MKPSVSEVNDAIEVLRWLRDEVRNGSFDGWGLRESDIVCTKTFLENLINGVYGERLEREGR